jgi:hypothetical protein
VELLYGPAAFRKRACAWAAEVADMYPACLIGSRAVALMDHGQILMALECLGRRK